MTDQNSVAARSLAIYDLPKHGEKAIPALVSIMEDKDEDVSVRRVAVQALGRIKGISAAKALVKATNDKTLAETAYEALGRLGMFTDGSVMPPKKMRVRQECQRLKNARRSN